MVWRPAGERQPLRLLAVAMLVVVVSGSVSCAGGPASPPEPTEQVRVSWSPFESTALFWIAQDRGFFRENGLVCEPLRFETGAASVDAVLEGEADICVGATEFPLTVRAFKGADLQAFACVARGEYVYVVARKDRGITKPSDLEGKRIGTTFGTIAQFYLGRFLELHGIPASSVTLVDLKKADEWVDAVAAGDVDAVATAQPYASRAMARLGREGVWWSAQGDQPLYGLALSRRSWIPAHGETLQRFLKALTAAEDYAMADPEGAKAILAKRLDFDPAYLEQVWRQSDFGLSLDRSLVAAMEGEERWIVASKLTTSPVTPDPVDFIHVDALRRLRPEAVNITQ